MSDLARGPRAAVTVTRIAGPVLLTLRGAPDVTAPALAAAGLPVPGVRRILWHDGQGVGWVAPDEGLLVLTPDRAAAVQAGLRAALTGSHHLLVDMTPGRAMLQLQGTGLREVLAKACPVDLAPGRFEPGELRRSRAGQIAVTFWLQDQATARLICARSVAGYALDLFTTLARPGGEVGIFD